MEEISCRVYRPRRPRDSPLFQLVERHLEELLRVWPERFARQPPPARRRLRCDLGPACYVEFQDAGHLAWTDLIPRHQGSIEYYCLAFLDTHLAREWSGDPARRLSDVADLRVK